MGEIRFVGTGETRGYPYPVCKKKKSHPEGKRIMAETRLPSFRHYPLTRGLGFPRSASETDV